MKKIAHALLQKSSVIKKKASGPLLDRIDINIEVPRIKFDELSSSFICENSSSIRERVQQARNKQLARFHNDGIFSNSEMTSAMVEKYCPLEDAAKQILKTAIESLHLSPRVYFRVLKIARTIADLSESESIKCEHLAEALQYRPKTD